MAVKKQSRSRSIAPARARKLSSFSTALCAGAAFLTAFGAAAPAFAGGGHYRGHSGYHHSGHVRVHAGFHGGGHHRGHFRGHRRGHGYYRGHGRIDGGGAALIALGVIGGAILINEAIESDRRDAYEPRYRGYDPRRDEYYYRRGYPSGAEYDSAYPENYADSGDSRDDSGLQRTPTPRRAPEPAPGAASDPLDDALLGAAAREPVAREPATRQDGVSFPVRIAYRECANEARNAAHRDGQTIAMPAEPTRIEQIGPDRVRLTADLTAQPQRGGQYLRVLTCEADGRGVTFLELI